MTDPDPPNAELEPHGFESQPPAADDPAGAADAAPHALPQRIGRYAIKQVLGSGGFGRMYPDHDDEIPRELERSCLKALSNRASDRYTTTVDMAEDLRHFLKTVTRSATPVVGALTVASAVGEMQLFDATASETPDSDRSPSGRK